MLLLVILMKRPLSPGLQHFFLTTRIPVKSITRRRIQRIMNRNKEKLCITRQRAWAKKIIKVTRFL